MTTAPAGTRADAPYKGPVGQGYVHRLVYSMTFQRPPEEARWETLVDAVSGEVVAFRDKNQYENRQVTGGVYPLTNTGVVPEPQSCGEMQSGWPMPFADTGLPAPNNVTNSAGVYDFTGRPRPRPSPVRSSTSSTRAARSTRAPRWATSTSADSTASTTA